MTLEHALKILGVNKLSSQEEIKHAYRKLAMVHHPDRGGDESAFKRIKEAYEFASTYYGKVSSGANRAKTFSRTIRVEISLEDAFSGASKDVIISDSPRIETQVDIVPGIIDGDLLSIYYVKGSHKNESGDEEIVNIAYNLVAWIKTEYVIEWGSVERDKRGDIKRDEWISPFKMICGGWHEVNTLSGKKVSIRIPEGLSANTLLKVKGHGYWKNSTLTEQGDLYLKIIPSIKKIFEYDSDELHQFVKKIKG